MTITTAIRLLLDQAATVDEATALLKQYDLHSSGGMMHHLALADAQGRSAVVEYIDNEMQVTETPVVTNFFITPGEYQGVGSEPSKGRFEILKEQYEKTGGIMDAAQLKEALSKAAQTAVDLSFYHRENFGNPLFFKVSP